jgi:hypothetical protein
VSARPSRGAAACPRTAAPDDPAITYEIFEPYAPGKTLRSLLVNKIKPLVEDYEARGYRLSTRQLFYAAITRTWITNSESQYRSFREMIKRARRGGFLDYASFEDRSRSTFEPWGYRDLRHSLEVARDTHVLRRWEGQQHYVELAVEKDALVGFLQPLAAELHVALSSTRGNDGDVPLKRMAERFKRAAVLGQLCVLIQGTDHDPTGWDMERDTRTRLAMFGADAGRVEVRRIALTLEQTRGLPDNPLKKKRSATTGRVTYADPRALDYIEATEQTTSWELDALPPEQIIALYRDAVLPLRDEQAYARVLRRETRDRAAIDRVIQGLR